MELPEDSVLIADVDYLLVVVDAVFPNSQPRVIAPQAGDDYRWPHVESKGLLCLKATRLVSDPGERVLQHLQWACELLSYSECERRSEFQREFTAYWNHSLSKKSKSLEVYSLIKPGGISREVVYVQDSANRRIVVADEKAELINWMRNSGGNPGDRDILPAWLSRLRHPWIPDEYPKVGRDVLQFIPEAIQRKVLIPGKICPVLFEVNTLTGPSFAAVLLKSATKSELIKGFRSLPRVPTKHIQISFSTRDVQRCPVVRVDSRWIHGRDHNQELPMMSSRFVVLIGCGALGSAIARLLAQSGVAKFLLIDPDHLSSANIERHVLGMPYVGKNKAQATAQMLRENFPHINGAKPYATRFELLTSEELEEISHADLIISAGIDFDGDAALDIWRRSLQRPPMHLCTWTEAFAICGHAILLCGSDSLMSGFDDNEQPVFRLTDWSEGSNALLTEAGCGNVFQPHGVVDLQSTIRLAALLAVDALLGKITDSCRRVWQGDSESVISKGGLVRPKFIENQTLNEEPWS